MKYTTLWMPVLAIALLISSCQISEKEMYLLPKDYTGIVVVFFAQVDGEPESYEDKRRVYKIPQNGILKTQFPNNPGWQDMNDFDCFYYISDSGKTRIPYIINISALSTEDTVVGGYANGITYLEDGDEIRYALFYVGTKEQIEDVSNSLKQEDILKLLEGV